MSASKLKSICWEAVKQGVLHRGYISSVEGQGIIHCNCRGSCTTNSCPGMKAEREQQDMQKHTRRIVSDHMLMGSFSHAGGWEGVNSFQRLREWMVSWLNPSASLVGGFIFAGYRSCTNDIIR